MCEASEGSKTWHRHVDCLVSDRSPWATWLDTNQLKNWHEARSGKSSSTSKVLWRYQISSSSDSSEIFIFSMADLIKFESELLGLRSRAVLKCLRASLCCSNFLKILPIWNHTLASFGAISCTCQHSFCPAVIYMHTTAKHG